MIWRASGGWGSAVGRADGGDVGDEEEGKGGGGREEE